MIRPIRTRLKSSALLAGSTWMMMGFGARLLSQALFFIIIARSLKVDGYGLFVGAAAFSAVVAPFAGLGMGSILIKNVARERAEFPVRWGNAIIVSVATGLVLLAALVGIAPLVLSSKIPVPIIVVIGAADLLFGRILDICGRAFQAVGLMRRTAELQVLPNLAKLVAALVLIASVRAPTAMMWSEYYLVCSIATAVLALWLVHREVGRPVFKWRSAFNDAREGIYFSISLSAQSIYNDVDKTMLAGMSTASAVGTYGAAYRLIDVAFSPVRSVLFASYADFFRAGLGGVRGAVRHARRLIPFSWSYAALVSVSMLLAAPLVPLILGKGYSDAVLAMRWLAVLPLMKAVHYLAADSLTGAGHQQVRSGIQILVAVFNVAVNIVLIPRYAWLGAAWSSIASDGLLALCLWIAIWHFCRREELELGIQPCSAMELTAAPGDTA